MDNPAAKGEESDKDKPPDSRPVPLACFNGQEKKNSVSSLPPPTSALPKGSLSSIDQISEFISFDASQHKVLTEVARKYRVLIPAYYFSLIKDLKNENDPIRKQCIPAMEELFDDPKDKIDPLGEEKTSATPFLVHRYPDRVLLLVTSRCLMYCRHCTRKRLWKKNNVEPTLTDIHAALDYVRNNKGIREVVISGGDPLTLNLERLDFILEEVSNISHVQVMRIGSRVPVVCPEKITKSLCRLLGKYEKLWVNLQFNHPNEITPESTEACRRLQKCGIPLSNQSVLLKGVNDDPEVMKELCQKLQSIKVRPYYLFQCDEVVGASHFRTSVFRGIEILEKMRGHTSGMCIPAFVVDGPDGRGKIPLAPQYLVSISPEKVILRNYKNEIIEYDNPGGF